MRLIDADALIEQLISNGCMFTYGQNVISAFISRIEGQTTVDIKTEVAREIFAEIENNAFAYGVNFVRNKKTLDELKNKYIGGVGE